MSPINNMIERKGLNFNPKAQHYLLSVAVNKRQSEQQQEKEEGEEEENKSSAIPVTNFKSNKLSQIDKKARAEEVMRMKEEGKDMPGSPSQFEAIRQPNKTNKQTG